MTPPNQITHKSALTQWLWLWLGLILIALGGGVAFNLHLEHDRTSVREQDRLSTQARVIAENMESQLASANRVLEDIRGDRLFLKSSSGLQAETLRLKALTNAMQGIRYISILDENGTLLASNQSAYIGNNFSYRNYFQTVKRHPSPDTLYVSPPFKSVLGSYVINLSRMIPGPRGEFAGIVTATLDPDYFKTLMTSVLYTPDMWDSIGHGDGLLFLMVPEREGMSGKNLAQPGSFFTRHRDSGKVAEVLTGTVYATNEVRMMAQHTVYSSTLKMDKPLIVAVSRDLDTIFQAWRRDVVAQTVLFGLIVIVSILGLYAYQRRQQLFERQANEAASALQQSAERLQLATDASSVGVWDYEIETDELVWDDSMYAIYGIDKATVTSLYEAWHSSLLPEDQVKEAAALEAAITQGTPYAPRFRIHRSDGELRDIQARARVYFNAAGKPVRMVGTNEDITERQQRESALQESEEKFRSTFDAAAIGMALVNREGRFMQVNDSLCRIVGYTQTELQQKTFQDITHPDDLEADLALLKELTAGTRASYQMEKRYFHKEGSIIWILLSGSAVRNSAGEILYFVAQIQDITERKALLDTLELQASQDFLTGLSNRRHFMEQGEVELARAQRHNNTLSLFMLDIDHFKTINDTYGHKAGDVVLQKLSDILRETLRTVDVIGRIGGEEFAVLLPDTDLQEAIEVAERLRQVVAGADVMREAGLPLHFTVSIGVTTLKEKSVNLDILLSLADQALYEAKATGRNKVCVAG
ncbi:MAG: diguanylate cyclase [Betaproteobacteria bacterium]|nr:diguanylate cyclase [Betaproteobacteria bacterium]